MGHQSAFINVHSRAAHSYRNTVQQAEGEVPANQLSLFRCGPAEVKAHNHNKRLFLSHHVPPEQGRFVPDVSVCLRRSARRTQNFPAHHKFNLKLVYFGRIPSGALCSSKLSYRALYSTR